MRVVAAGMVRSGSTWQYNCLRIIMEQAGLNPVCYWVQDYKGQGGNVLIKTHEIKPDIVSRSIIFTAIRDAKGIKESMKRRGEYLAKNPDSRFNGTANPNRYNRYHRWYRWWAQHAFYIQKYQELKTNPEKVVNDHIKVLGLTGKVDPKKVLEELNNTKPPETGHDPKTMLHAGHITKE